MTKEENEIEIGEEANELLKGYFDKGYSWPHIVAVLAGALVAMLHGGVSLNGEKFIDLPLKAIAEICLVARFREKLRTIN
jgi:hypothetical protein